MARELHRIDIVGQRIGKVLQTPWEWSSMPDYGPEGDVCCDVFVVLASETTFKLGETSRRRKIHESAVDHSTLIPAEFRESEPRFDTTPDKILDEIIGSVILDVVTEVKHRFGLLLSNSTILRTGVANRDGYCWFGAQLEKFDLDRDLDNYSTIWQGEPLAKSDSFWAAFHPDSPP